MLRMLLLYSVKIRHHHRHRGSTSGQTARRCEALLLSTKLTAHYPNRHTCEVGREPMQNAEERAITHKRTRDIVFT